MNLSPWHRLPVHRLAAKSLLLELEVAVGAGSEGDGRRALEASLSSGVVCSLTAYVGVNMERGQLVQGPLVRRDVPLAGNPRRDRASWRQVGTQHVRGTRVGGGTWHWGRWGEPGAREGGNSGRDPTRGDPSVRGGDPEGACGGRHVYGVMSLCPSPCPPDSRGLCCPLPAPGQR